MRIHLASTVVGEPQTVRVEVDRNGHAVLGARASINWSMNDMPMVGGDTMMLTPAEPGFYEQRGFVFSMAGSWHARVVIRENASTTRTAMFAVTVAD